MPEIQYPKNPNSDTAFVVQEDGTKNRALMTAPQDTSSLELPTNSNSCKGYVTVDGKKQRVILTADIGGGGSSYTAGTGIDITNDVISVNVETAPTTNGTTRKLLVSDGTNVSAWTNGFVINYNAFDSNGYINFSKNNQTPYKGVVVGFNAQVGSYTGQTVIGGAASSSNAFTVAIGYNVSVTARSAIQLGCGSTAKTNSDANTFKVGNDNGNFEIMSADGTVPTARLTKVNTTVTLAAADWSSNTQTVTVSGVKADSVVFVSPAPASASDYASAGILCTSQSADSLTFSCTQTPSAAIVVNIVCM